MGWLTSLARAANADRPVISARDFVRFVAFPNIFLTVVLIATSSFIGFGPTELLSRLTIAGLLILLTFVVHGGMEVVAGRFLMRAGAGMIGLLVLFSFAFHLHPMTNLFLPLAGLIVSSGAITLTRADRWMLTLGLLCLAGCVAVVGVILFEQSIVIAASGLTLLGLCAAIADAWGRARGPESAVPSDSRAPESRLIGPQGALAERSDRTGTGSGDEPRELKELAQRIFVQESLAEFAWRLPLLMLLTGGMVVALAYISHGRSVVFGILWLALAGGQLWLLQQLPRQKTAADLHSRSLLIVLAQLGWWLLLDRLTSQQTMYPDLLAGILIFGFSALPWLRREAWLLVIVIVLLVCSRIPSTRAPELVLLALCFGVPLAMRMFAITYVNFVTRTTLSLIRRVSDSVVSSESIVTMFARQLGLIGDTRRVLMVVGGERGVVVEENGSASVPTDRIYLRGIATVVKDTEQSEGMLSVKELGEQYLHPCFLWFGFVPRQLGFIEIQAVIAERSERIVLLFPISFTIRLAGIVRTFRALGVLAAVIRLLLGGQRNRFVSDDLLLSTQQAVSQRENELSQVIHQVNNIAQDFSVLLDQFKEIEKPTGASAVLLDSLERLTRCLSTGVSDIRVARELGRIVEFAGSHPVAIRETIEELHIFGNYRAERFSGSFLINSDIPESTVVKVSSRELFETALRLLVRLSEQRFVGRGKIQVNIHCAETLVLWTVLGNGRPFEADELASFANNADRKLGTSNEADWFRAILNFARISQGRLDVLSPTPEFSTAICLAVPRAEAVVARSAAVEGWALLVDDNPQVTSFYARVAEALGMPHETASGVARAIDILNGRGQPRIVVTDLQIGHESGLDLVRHLRQVYSAKLPVVVVSGNSGANVAAEVASAGATLFLQKPVSRGTLVTEIRRLLSFEAS